MIKLRIGIHIEMSQAWVRLYPFSNNKMRQTVKLLIREKTDPKFFAR